MLLAGERRVEVVGESTPVFSSPDSSLIFIVLISGLLYTTISIDCSINRLWGNSMIKLTCPSCNGTLELPDNMDIAHCLYCGTKILLRENSGKIKNFIELSKIALDAKNYKEALEYCNKVLEIDPNNVDAWIDKAISTFYLPAFYHCDEDSLDEAISYLMKAYSLSPDDTRINALAKDLRLERLKNKSME